MNGEKSADISTTTATRSAYSFIHSYGNILQFEYFIRSNYLPILTYTLQQSKSCTLHATKYHPTQHLHCGAAAPLPPSTCLLFMRYKSPSYRNLGACIAVCPVCVPILLFSLFFCVSFNFQIRIPVFISICARHRIVRMSFFFFCRVANCCHSMQPSRTPPMHLSQFILEFIYFILSFCAFSMIYQFCRRTHFFFSPAFIFHPVRCDSPISTPLCVARLHSHHHTGAIYGNQIIFFSKCNETQNGVSHLLHIRASLLRDNMQFSQFTYASLSRFSSRRTHYQQHQHEHSIEFVYCRFQFIFQNYCR